MRNMWIIARRELGSYFISPIAYIVVAALIALTSNFFSLILFFSREATLRYLFSNLTTIMLFVAPILAMRLLAEEQRSGTIELLLTSPVNDWEVVWGKWLASFILWLFILVLTLIYPFILKVYGSPDWGPIISGYIGLIVVGGTLLAIGVLTSSLTQNQIVAAVLGVVFTIGFWIVGGGSSLLSGPLASVLNYLSLSQHINSFYQGVIDVKNIIYYLSVIFGALYIATRVVEIRRWR